MTRDKSIAQVKAVISPERHRRLKEIARYRQCSLATLIREGVELQLELSDRVSELREDILTDSARKQLVKAKR